ITTVLPPETIRTASESGIKKGKGIRNERLRAKLARPARTQRAFAVSSLMTFRRSLPPHQPRTSQRWRSQLQKNRPLKNTKQNPSRQIPFQLRRKTILRHLPHRSQFSNNPLELQANPVNQQLQRSHTDATARPRK